MAETQRFDAKVFNPEVFGAYMERVPQLRTNELLNSRALVGNPQIRGMFASQTGTYYGKIPLYGLLGGDPVNYDGKTNIPATSTTTYAQGVIVTGRAKAWVERDFSYDITGGADFMGNIANQVSHYWDIVNQDILLKILEGIYAVPSSGDNKLGEFREKHTYDITGADTPAQQIVNATTLNTAIQRASGAYKKNFSLVIMHSAVATNIENLRLLEFMKYTDQQNVTRDLSMGTWNGRTVIIDDSMPTNDVAAAEPTETDPGSEAYTAYTTYVLGEGAIFYEDLGAKVAYEMDRDPKINGGEDTLYSRQRKVFAPKGISFKESGAASLSPTNAELSNAKNWQLVDDGVGSYYDHQALLISRIISRG